MNSGMGEGYGKQGADETANGSAAAGRRWCGGQCVLSSGHGNMAFYYAA